MAKKGPITIHAGWFPQLLKGNPSRKFSSQPSPTGITVRGYNREFVSQIRNLSEERAQQLRDDQTVLTVAGMATTGSSKFAAFMNTVMQGKRASRALAWKDLVDDASAYKARSTAMSIRGQSIWYMLGNTGPKEMAQTLLDMQPPFKFKKAEKWYTHTAAPQSATKHATWAQKVLKLHPDNIDKNVSVENVKHIGDVAEELIFDEFYDEIKAVGKAMDKKVPREPKGSARGRDIDSGLLGEAESTEVLKKEAHHGLPDDYIKLAKERSQSGEITKEAWREFMEKDVITEWNDYTRKVLDMTNNDIEEAKKIIIKTPAGEMGEHLMDFAQKEMSISQLRKMRHEFSIADLEEKSEEFGTFWREGIPISDRGGDGMRTYASTKLSLNQQLQFEVLDVKLVTSHNHTMGLLELNNSSLSAQTAAYYSAQMINFAHSTMNNAETAHTIDGITRQGFGRAMDFVKPKINVSFSPKVYNAYLEKVIKEISSDMVKGSRKESTKIQDALQKKAKNYNHIFWALPYISIEEGLYKGN